MAENEDGSEKSESASSKKLQDARDKGNFPRSKDLSSALLLIDRKSGDYLWYWDAFS